MLDVHPAHHAASTWRDFFIHIATISVGLLIAVGLEQTVEYVHHRHQRAELREQMREEARRNILVERNVLQAAAGPGRYLHTMRLMLASGRTSGGMVEVAPLTGSGLVGGMGVAPSRGTWVAAQAAGVAALLTADELKIYSRLDFNAQESVMAEDAMLESFRQLDSEMDRAQYDPRQASPSRMSVAHRDDLLFRIGQVENAIENVELRVTLEEGADEAIADDVRSMDALYAYQRRALNAAALHTALGRLTGTQATFTSPKP